MSDGRSRPEVEAALKSADAAIARGKAFYEHRNRVAVLTGMLSLPDLLRLTGVLNRLTSDDLEMVLAYAEGLAEWGTSGTGLPDAKEATAGTWSGT